MSLYECSYIFNILYDNTIYYNRDYYDCERKFNFKFKINFCNNFYQQISITNFQKYKYTYFKNNFEYCIIKITLLSFIAGLIFFTLIKYLK